jgi:predicted aldo/keto reductase-like oxidoreductase
MKLPQEKGTPNRIDESASIEIIRYAIDHGVNYLDLGYPYDLDRQKAVSSVIRKALQNRYREKVRLAANFPANMLDTSTELNRLLDQQLRWLEVDNIDFCLIGGMDRGTWTKLEELKIINHAELAIDAGKSSKLGFTFHDQFQYLRNVLNAYDKWAVGRFQYSLMDIDHHPGVSGLQLAARNGLAVVVTEPLKSNRLIKNIPEPVAKVWNGFYAGSGTTLKSQLR